MLVCEGEKAADAAGRLLPDHVAVTSPSGSKSAGKASWIDLSGRAVTIWPDADEAGQDYALAVARLLQGSGASVAIINPPADEGWDAADAERDGWGADRALALIAAALPSGEYMHQAHGLKPRTGPDATPLEDNPKDGGSKESVSRRSRQSDGLLSLLDGCELWHDAREEPFASVPIDGHFENMPVRSERFRMWLRGRHYAATSGTVGGQAIQDAIEVIMARAVFDGPKYPTFIRIGEHDGDIYLDLGGRDWKAVKVTARDGWSMIDRPPVKFLRSDSMRALPEPEKGEGIELLRDMVNVRSEGDFRLFVSWLVSGFCPAGPYPVLVINGEQGSSKSTVARIARWMIDPNEADIRAEPQEIRDLVVMAKNGWVVAVDNVSSVQAWLSDALCRLSTGGGISFRAKYTDWGEAIFNGQRPIMLNGIPDLVSRPDLANRAILLTLPAISGNERKTEREFNEEFERRRPFILGALLDAVSGALRCQSDVRMTEKPRMADFALWVAAAEKSGALGWAEGSFLDAYRLNQEGAVETVIESNPVAGAVRTMVGSEDWQGSWQGTATALIEALGAHVPEAVRRSRVWPTAASIKGKLRGLQPAMRTFGIIFDLDARSTGRDRSRQIGIRSQAS
ncbi:MAG: ATP-binding protein [Rhodospirillales bacterium]|nr:ATP-binding protein [Rhodospirillales bacterium]